MCLSGDVMFSCTFIGHKDCPYNIKEKIRIAIEELIIYHNVTDFYIGTNGVFDKYVYDILCDLEKNYSININVVLAYLNIKQNEYYDDSKTLFPLEFSFTPKRFAIVKRNEYMLNKSQYLICYVNNTFTNSYKFLEIARKRNLHIINLGQLVV